MVPNNLYVRLEQINNKDILEDPRWHQKPISMRVSYIVENFKPTLVEPIVVAEHEGKYHLIDGQNLRAVLAAINGTEDFPIICKVYHNLSIDEMAALVYLLHNRRKPGKRR